MIPDLEHRVHQNSDICPGGCPMQAVLNEQYENTDAHGNGYSYFLVDKLRVPEYYVSHQRVCGVQG